VHGILKRESGDKQKKSMMKIAGDNQPTLRLPNIDRELRNGIGEFSKRHLFVKTRAKLLTTKNRGTADLS